MHPTSRTSHRLPYLEPSGTAPRLGTARPPTTRRRHLRAAIGDDFTAEPCVTHAARVIRIEVPAKSVNVGAQKAGLLILCPAAPGGRVRVRAHAAVCSVPFELGVQTFIIIHRPVILVAHGFGACVVKLATLDAGTMLPTFRSDPGAHEEKEGC